MHRNVVGLRKIDRCVTFTPEDENADQENIESGATLKPMLSDWSATQVNQGFTTDWHQDSKYRNGNEQE